MARQVLLQREGQPGATSAYAGFSWTTLFFGFLPALFRRDGMGVIFGLGVCLSSVVAWTAYLGWLPWIIWAASYNRNHLGRLRSDGWQPVL